MSKKARPKGKQRTDSSSVIIPIVVAIAVVAIIVGAIVTLEKRQSAVGVTPTGTISVPIITAQPRPTTDIPFPAVARMSVKETKEKMDKGQAVLIDVRTKESYDQSHAGGALSIPEEEIDARLGELPRDKLLVLYCT